MLRTLVLLRYAIASLSLLLLAACSGGGSALNGAVPSNPSNVQPAAGGESSQLSPSFDALAIPQPFTPGVDPEPTIAAGLPPRALTAQERSEEAKIVARAQPPTSASASLRQAQNVVGKAEYFLGIKTNPSFNAGGSIVAMGVQPHMINFRSLLHPTEYAQRNQLANNQCLEFGIEYGSQAPTLYAVNNCSGGNYPAGFAFEAGLVGFTGGNLITWLQTNNGLLELGHNNDEYRVVIEEIQRADGWHLLGYNWKTGKYVDMLNGIGVSGAKSACCGFVGLDSQSSSNDPQQPTLCNEISPVGPGQGFLYDVGNRAYFDGAWVSLNNIPTGGFTMTTKTDCSNISGVPDPKYTSPYFSGGYVKFSAAMFAGDWWLIQR